MTDCFYQYAKQDWSPKGVPNFSSDTNQNACVRGYMFYTAGNHGHPVNFLPSSAHSEQLFPSRRKWIFPLASSQLPFRVGRSSFWGTKGDVAWYTGNYTDDQWVRYVDDTTASELQSVAVADGS